VACELDCVHERVRACGRHFPGRQPMTKSIF